MLHDSGHSNDNVRWLSTLSNMVFSVFDPNSESPKFQGEIPVEIRPYLDSAPACVQSAEFP